MTITELIAALEAVRAEHGDVLVTVTEPLEPTSAQTPNVSLAPGELFFEESTGLYRPWRDFSLDEPELQRPTAVVQVH